MNAKYITTAVLLFAVCCPFCPGQIEALRGANRMPRFLLLVHQHFQPGKAKIRQDLEVQMARAFERLDVQLPWIETEVLTGTPGALFIDPFDSYEELDRAGATQAAAYAKYPELARLQQEIDDLVSDSKVVVVFRRDDLGFRPDNIDLSKTRYFRIDVLHVHPGHEADFVQAAKIASGADQRINSPLPWAVYEVDAGTSRPTYLVFTPMHMLKDADEILNEQKRIQQADSATNGLLHEIARDTYSSTDTDFYAVSPAMSHVSRQFAAGDPDFWKPKHAAAAKPAPEKK